MFYCPWSYYMFDFTGLYVLRLVTVCPTNFSEKMNLKLWAFEADQDFPISSSQSHNHAGRRGTTDNVATIPFHLSMSSVALRESPNFVPVHSLMISSHRFFCLPLLLAPFTDPCKLSSPCQRILRCCHTI